MKQITIRPRNISGSTLFDCMYLNL